jgi:hypothetical protein
MSNKNNGYLANNNLSPDLRDWQHAARMFTDNNQIYGPKQKYLFHVAISINSAALQTTVLNNNYRSVMGMLVKSVILPKFTVAVDKVIQYNRKKNIQKQITYEDTTIKFHDDNLGIINLLWQNYFNYYYSDSSSAGIQGAYKRTATRNFSFIRSAYGLDSGSTEPFFNYITIYQMAMGNYISYKLINPLISSFEHAQMDYSQSASPAEVSMNVSFEAVEYGSGVVADSGMEGFGGENYDRTTSPLLQASPSDPLGSINSTPDLLKANLVNDNKSSFIDNAIRTVNNYQNTNNAVPVANGVSGVSLTSTSTATSTGGLANVSFPSSTSTNNNTVIAKQSTLGLT